MPRLPTTISLPYPVITALLHKWSLVEFEVRPHEGQCLPVRLYLLAHRLDGRPPDILVIIPSVRHAHQQAQLYVIDRFLHEPCRGRLSSPKRWDCDRGPIRALVAVRQREHGMQRWGILDPRAWQEWCNFITRHALPITKSRQDRSMIIRRSTWSRSEHGSGLDI